MLRITVSFIRPTDTTAENKLKKNRQTFQAPLNHYFQLDQLDIPCTATSNYCHVNS